MKTTMVYTNQKEDGEARCGTEEIVDDIVQKWEGMK